MKNKAQLIQDIKQFFLDNDIEDSIDLSEIGRCFTTSTNSESGEIDIISLSQSSFIYVSSWHLDEIDGKYEVLSKSDLKEILNVLYAYKADKERTKKRFSN
jgi:hypothetical protein